MLPKLVFKITAAFLPSLAKVWSRYCFLLSFEVIDLAISNKKMKDNLSQLITIIRKSKK